MKEFDLLDPSHIIFTSICVAIIVFLPRLFVGKSDVSKKILIANKESIICGWSIIKKIRRNK